MQELYQQIQENTDPNAAIIMYRQKVMQLQSQIDSLNSVIQKLTIEQQELTEKLSDKSGEDAMYKQMVYFRTQSQDLQ